ncbi:phosphatidylglycerophosphatase A family protein [Polynucleobacter sp. HIN5]|uniref:phosphatidylglycerophosphatase A family protein n=1 Tax=Polynucleobacter sp. HIN5 TaxID=3047864 RepID=UPI002572E422|nr:phosphatidylglycerophosphatase A [Polynucleobacter sp. HIN5]
MRSAHCPSLNWMLGSVHRVFGIGFGVGLAPIAPGTAGTLLAWALFLILNAILSTTVMFVLLSVGTLYGLWACGQCSHDLGRPDDGSIVWDEIIAFAWILQLLESNDLWVQAIAFLIFRFFDAAKPWPINRIDQYFKKNWIHQEHINSSQIIKHGFGIMIDDLIAALFTILIMMLGIHWLA